MVAVVMQSAEGSHQVCLRWSPSYPPSMVRRVAQTDGSHGGPITGGVVRGFLRDREALRGTRSGRTLSQGKLGRLFGSGTSEPNSPMSQVM